MILDLFCEFHRRIDYHVVFIFAALEFSYEGYGFKKKKKTTKKKKKLIFSTEITNCVLISAFGLKMVVFIMK